jgi:hypothetical protein
LPTCKSVAFWTGTLWYLSLLIFDLDKVAFLAQLVKNRRTNIEKIVKNLIKNLSMRF